MNFAQAIAKAFRLAYEKGHRTFWFEDGKTEENKPVFAYVTWDPGTAQAAQKVLNDAGLLCHETLGDLGETSFTFED